MKQTLGNCARCGQRHSGLTFLKLERPAGDYTHWTTCPVTGEPILLKITETSADRFPPVDPRRVQPL